MAENDTDALRRFRELFLAFRIDAIGPEVDACLAGGCEIPYNAKPENLKAMTRSVFKYGICGAQPALQAPIPLPGTV